MDVLLSLCEKGVLWRTKRIALNEPPALQGTKPGKYVRPSANTWSPTQLTAPWTVAEPRIRLWVEACMGANLLHAIRGISLPDPAVECRVLTTSDPACRRELFATPWEILESAHGPIAAPLTDRMYVLRVLDPAAQDAPLVVTERLRIVVTWASPKNDIPDLPAHLDQWRDLCANRSDVFQLCSVLELTDINTAINELGNCRPHLWYHIGHGVQNPGTRAQLLIGSNGHPGNCSVAQFQTLVHQVGPPRVLFLNACALLVGMQPEFLLGATDLCDSQIETLITMMTVVPVKVAYVFAEEFIRRLAAGDSLVSAVKQARFAIHTNCVGLNADLDFLPFIPAVVQYSRAVRPISVDIDRRQARRLLDRLHCHLEKLRIYIDRDHEAALRKLIVTPEHCVALLYGARHSGNSTSLRRLVAELATVDAYVAGKRYIYFDYLKGNPVNPSDPLPAQGDQVLANVAGHFEELFRLKQALNARAGKPEFDSIVELAAWLREEQEENHHYCICIDNLPDQLVGALVERASAVIREAGLVLFTSESNCCQPNHPVQTLEVQFLSDHEIADGLKRLGRDSGDQQVAIVTERCGRIPYLVVLQLARAEVAVASKPTTMDLLTEFDVTDPEREVLRFVALCAQHVPDTLLKSVFKQDDIGTLTSKKPLLIESKTHEFGVPELLRGQLLIDETPETGAPLHQIAYEEFAALADEHESSLDSLMILQVNTWYREALDHALDLAEYCHASFDEEARDVNIDGALNIAETLHRRRFVRGHEVLIMLDTWRHILERLHAMGLYDRRSADFHYAECLSSASRFEEAEQLLEQVTMAGHVDRYQLSAFLLWHNLIKDRGGADRAERIEKLQNAMAIANDMVDQDGATSAADSEWAKRQLANLKYTLGHTLGYGRDADVERALSLVQESEVLFREVGDSLRYYRAVAEQIEIRRYNDRLSAADRTDASETLKQNLRKLLASGFQYDAIRHLYELGSLTDSSIASADWYLQAHQLAKGSDEPIATHAKVKYLIETVTADPLSFGEHVTELRDCAGRLREFLERAWSRRILRECLSFLAEGLQKAGDNPAALAAWRETADVIELIATYGEGRRDQLHREKISAKLEEFAVQHGNADDVERARRLRSSGAGSAPPS